jgi:hypothetical protein
MASVAMIQSAGFDLDGFIDSDCRQLNPSNPEQQVTGCSGRWTDQHVVPALCADEVEPQA